ncbi:MAG: glycosyltransferase family protein [Planctomycetes bacterium]|nr:glycosyltransferase family protein [Planctomycetota bacterium]
MRIVATVQARMSSERLPGKVLIPINGRCILERQLERIKRSRLIDEVVVATTTNPADGAIVELCNKMGVKIFRGSEEDVLGRIAATLKAFAVELHVEMIGDSPFSDPHIIDEVIGYYLKHQGELDYVSNGTKLTYPSGMEVNVYPARVLLEVESQIAREDPLREHVDVHLNKNPCLRKVCLEAPERYRRQGIFLEVDTEKDFEMVSRLFKHFDDAGKAHFSLAQILDVLDAYPEIIAINQKEERRWWQFKEP